MSLNETQKKGYRTLIAIAVIGVAVYLGFTPLFQLVPDGVPKAVISSSFGAIFVIILTMYLLNKQTEVEQESKRGERIFDEKVQLYTAILDTTKSILADGIISKEEINKLPFPVIKLQMLGGDESISSYINIYSKMNDIYNKSDHDDVEIDETQKEELYKLLIEFAGKCRVDIGISDEGIKKNVFDSTVKTINQTGKKKRDNSKFSFDGKDLKKNHYAYAVIKDYINTQDNLSIKEFSKLFPRDLRGKSKTYELWKTYEEAMQHYEETKYCRYFISTKQPSGKSDVDISGKEYVLKLADAEICITRAWDITGIEKFINLIKKNNIRHE